MIKFIFIFILINFFTGASYAESEYKVIAKINKKIITNYDIDKEKNFLLALNPAVSSASQDEIKEMSKYSIIKEIIKEEEISKYIDINYDNPKLIALTKNIYLKLNLKNETEFKNYLLEKNIAIQGVLRKLAIEAAWNSLIYDKFYNKVNIDEIKIKKTIDDLLKNSEKQKMFFLSEILFTGKDKKEIDEKYNKILQSIKNNGFNNTAAIYSESDSAKFSGEIGWIRKNEVSELIYKEISEMKTLSYSQPIKIPSGFIIIYLNDLKEEKIEIDYDVELKKMITYEKNRQLNMYSTIYYKRIEKNTFIDEK